MATLELISDAQAELVSGGNGFTLFDLSNANIVGLNAGIVIGGEAQVEKAGVLNIRRLTLSPMKSWARSRSFR